MTATALFISNINLLRFSGYFDSQAQLRPLRHTWSLAVEEQFYLVFPLFLAGIWKWQRKRLAPYIALCAIASLALSAWTLHHYPSAAFYLAPTRAYELMTGVFWPQEQFPRFRRVFRARGVPLLA